MDTIIKEKHDPTSISKKIIIILGLTVGLNIPLSQVSNQIYDRQEFETKAQEQVASGWGTNVAFSSPVISVPDHWIYPVNSETTIDVNSQEKKRGVFSVPVYTATLKTKVSFKDEKLNPAKRKAIIPDYLLIVVEPSSAIQSFKVTDSKTGKELKAKLISGGIKLSVAEVPNTSFVDMQFDVEVIARGTGFVTYNSSADQDQVKMLGNWIKPKFSEKILPSETKLSSTQFEASWRLNALPKWENEERQAKSIGFTHLWVGSDYSLIERSVKYGLLFIALTFILIFIVEFMSGIIIHPLQYGLIGLAISMFYLLLLATSERLGFHISYAISSLAVTSLIAFYVHGFLKNKKFIKMILAEQILLSTFFYVLLTLEESAFLVGSIGLFGALATFMTLTRRFDWYAGSFTKKHDA